MDSEMASRPRAAPRLLPAAAAFLLLAATACAEGGHYGRELLQAPAPVCGSTVPGVSVNASTFTLAFDAASGCFTVGAGAACDPARGHCCVGAAAPKPPKFASMLIKPSETTPCGTQAELKNIKVKVGSARLGLALAGSDLSVKLGSLPSAGGTACLDFSKASAACNSASKLCGAGGCDALLVTKTYAKSAGGSKITCCLGLDRCAGVTCPLPAGECEAPGACNPSTGQCSAAEPANDGTPCSIGSCRGGVCTDLCVGVTCQQRECQTAPGACDPSTGECGAGPPVANGTTCFAGSCQGGVCADPCAGVTCQRRECETAPGTCKPTTGLCVAGPPAGTGTECSIGSCKAGACRGATQVLIYFFWPGDQRDLDTRTAFAGEVAGANCGDGGKYVKWVSGDDRVAGGREAVLVDVAAAYNDGAVTPGTPFTIDLAAGWFESSISDPGSGPAGLTVGGLDVNSDWRRADSLALATTVDISPGRQTGCVATPVGSVTVTIQPDPRSGAPRVTGIAYSPPR